MSRDLTAAERLASSHAIESATDWQYGVVWRMARDTDPQPVLGPPAGDGWVLNTECGDYGNEVRKPQWSDGTVVMQLTHWRRRSAGMTNAYPQRKVHERVTWEGDPKP